MRDTAKTAKGEPNPDIQIVDCYKYTDRVEQVGILTLIRKYDVLNPSVHKWDRTQASLIIEWDLHSIGYSIFKLDNLMVADLDNNGEHMLADLWNRIFP